MPSMNKLEAIIQKVQKNPELAQDSHIPIEFRKYLFAYLNGIPKNKQLKQTIAKVKGYAELVELIKKYFGELEV